MRTMRLLGGVVVTGLLLVTAGPSFAGPEPGRTDGPEGSEYGKGGYSRYGLGGEYFLEGFFGSAQVDVEVEGADNTSQTDLLAGLTLGYQIEDWLYFQVGYGHISDQKLNLYSVGTRSRYDLSPFGYFLTLDAGLLSPDGGDSNFSVTPGAGVDLMISEKLQVGLAFQHDFVMSDDNLDIDRFTAKLRFTF
jgi:hypothetical protein